MPIRSQPFAELSTINLAAKAVEANRVMVGLGPSTTGGPDDAICVYNSAGTSTCLLMRTGGTETRRHRRPPGYQFQALPPTRICDTRISTTFCSEGAIGPAVSRLIAVAGDSDIPSKTSTTTVVAVVANLTAVAPTATTFLTAYPGTSTDARKRRTSTSTPESFCRTWWWCSSTPPATAMMAGIPV